MPEVGDLTPSEYDRVGKRTLFSCIRIKNTTRGQVVLSRGEEPPKAGLMTGVKS